MSKTQEHAPYRVGDRVRIDFGRRKLTGTIVEDRGAIGAGGRHLYRVDVPMEPLDPMTVEVPEDDIEALGAEDQVMLDKAKILEYLVTGGLVSILQSNLSGGRNQPRVWLCLDNLGNVTHTFLPERGRVGGRLVPFRATQEDKVFLPRREEVKSFLESFGLTGEESYQVISEVGTAP